MTAFSITIPYLRTSPIHIPRRDLMLSVADSLEMSVTVVQTDNPDSPPIELSGGIGGPALTLFIWPWNCHQRSWDYNAPMSTPGTSLWSGTATISNEDTGTFAVSFPIGTMAAWPRRAAWSLQLDWNHGAQSQQMLWGYLNVMWSGNRLVAPTAITTSGNSMILTPDSLVA